MLLVSRFRLELLLVSVLEAELVSIERFRIEALSLPLWAVAEAPLPVLSVVSVAPISPVSLRAQPANPINVAAINANFFIISNSLFCARMNGPKLVCSGALHLHASKLMQLQDFSREGRRGCAFDASPVREFSVLQGGLVGVYPTGR